LYILKEEGVQGVHPYSLNGGTCPSPDQRPIGR